MNYSDVYLVPKFSKLYSRSQADISVNFLGRKFKAPWIPANMESVIDVKTAKWLSENDYFYIMHRFHDTLNFVKTTNEENWKTISISIGVGEMAQKIIDEIVCKSNRVDFITIDVAHGHHLMVNEMINYIRAQKFVNEPKIIAGNIATPEAVKGLANWGADAVKVGIAGGAACSTKHQTGFHIPMFSCVKNCFSGGGGKRIVSRTFNVYDPLKNTTEISIDKATIPIIADGGIRENGDIPKALVAGATMVMAGSLFAACKDAPGENVYDNQIVGNKHWIDPRSFNAKLIAKRYHGSASARQKGEQKHVEGIVVEIPCNGMTYAEKYQELTESLSSAVSYAGGSNLSAFKNVEFVKKD